MDVPRRVRGELRGKTTLFPRSTGVVTRSPIARFLLEHFGRSILATLYPPSLLRLIETLRCLPGVGPKSAQRMAFHLLEKDRNGGKVLAQALHSAMDGVGRCQRCRMFAD